jgi:tetratricopeptide (TPR) repeat protein
MFFNFSFISAQSDLAKAISLFDENKYEEARDILEEILDENDSDSEALFYLGKTNISLKDYGEASENLEDAIEIDEKNAEYHFWLGQAYAGDAQNSSFISAAFIAPKIKDEFARAVEIDPTHIGAYIGLVNFHLNAPGIVGGDIEEAYKAGKALLNLDEKNGRLTLINYFVKKEQFDSVDIQLKAVEEKYGDDKDIASFYNRYGYSLIKREKFDEAIVYFEKQVKLLPKNPNSYDSLGDGYRAAGKYKLAKENYEKALSIDPEFEASKENLKQLEELVIE